MRTHLDVQTADGCVFPLDGFHWLFAAVARETQRCLKRCNKSCAARTTWRHTGARSSTATRAVAIKRDKNKKKKNAEDGGAQMHSFGVGGDVVLICFAAKRRGTTGPTYRKSHIMISPCAPPAYNVLSLTVTHITGLNVPTNQLGHDVCGALNKQKKHRFQTVVKRNTNATSPVL